MAEKDEVLFSLWVYVPLEWFDGEQRRYWDAYIDFHEKMRGGPVFILGSSVTISPEEYMTIRRELADFFNRQEGEIADCYYFQEQSGRFFLSPWRPVLGMGTPEEPPYHVYTRGQMPWAWYLLFEDNERVFYWGGWEGNIGYSTKLARASERLKKAVEIIDQFATTSRDNQEEDPRRRRLLEMAEELKAELLGLRGWFTYYPPITSIIMDYSNAFKLISPNVLKEDRSSRDVWQLLTHLEAGEVDQAMACLERMEERQKSIVTPSTG